MVFMSTAAALVLNVKWSAATGTKPKIVFFALLGSALILSHSGVGPSFSYCSDDLKKLQKNLLSTFQYRLFLPMRWMRG